MITKFAVVGDPHLNSVPPSSRIDDYPAESLRKLEFIGNYCKSNNIEIVIMLGDVFTRYTQHLIYLNKVLELFSRFCSQGLKFYTIVGNHDLSSEREDSLPKSPLQTLFSSGAVEELIDLEYNGIIFSGLRYTQSLKKVSNTRDYKVCVCHRFYESSLTDLSLTESMVRRSGYDLFLCGHDHVKYDNVCLTSDNGSQVWVVRPGSLMRGSSHQYQLDREPSFEVIFVDIPTKRVKTKTIIIPHQKSELVFSVQAMDKEKRTVDMFSISEQISNLISQMNKRNPTASVYSVMDRMTIRPEVRSLLEQYFMQAGLYRE